MEYIDPQSFMDGELDFEGMDEIDTQSSSLTFNTVLDMDNRYC